jgi:hypothetical protein
MPYCIRLSHVDLSILAARKPSPEEQPLCCGQGGPNERCVASNMVPQWTLSFNSLQECLDFGFNECNTLVDIGCPGL